MAETPADNFRRTETGLECIGGKVTAWTHVPSPATREIHRLADREALLKIENSRLSRELKEAREALASSEAVAIPMALAKEIWTIVKDARDREVFAATRASELSGLLKRMKEAGLAAWIPTLDEVIAAGPYVRVGFDETLEEASARAALSGTGKTEDAPAPPKKRD